MEKTRSRLTSQGQVSVPAAVRGFLQLVPGSMLSWSLEGDRVVVERVKRHATVDVHKALFPETQGQGRGPQPKTLPELKEGVRQQMRRRHARG